MLTLHLPAPVYGTPSASPFCIKIEAYCRFAGAPFTVVPANPLRAPKGKVPYGQFEDGACLGDSQFLIEEIKRRHGDPLDAELTEDERARGHVVRRMLEEATYFHVVHTRWIRDDAWAVYSRYFLSLLPPVLGHLIIRIMRRKVRSALHAQGTGRHSVGEIQAMGVADVEAVSTLLGDNPYLLGQRVTSYDATVLSFLWAILAFPVDSPMRAAAASKPNLVAYVERLKASYFAAAA